MPALYIVTSGGCRATYFFEDECDGIRVAWTIRIGVDWRENFSTAVVWVE